MGVPTFRAKVDAFCTLCFSFALPRQRSLKYDRAKVVDLARIKRHFSVATMGDGESSCERTRARLRCEYCRSLRVAIQQRFLAGQNSSYHRGHRAKPGTQSSSVPSVVKNNRRIPSVALYRLGRLFTGFEAVASNSWASVLASSIANHTAADGDWGKMNAN